ncbi:MAG: alpha-glucosidase C-terminal domain-containing protein [Acetatifactor sp.]|nr:alpha-glucosidase C-terminal domain-containing protein [Acetatifactor sp.]
MAWYDEAVFYHIYPLGMLDAPRENSYGEPVHRLPDLIPWIGHLQQLGVNALYIGPLFESVGHGYETTDYKKLDSRLGDNEDLKTFVAKCHEAGIRVILDGVFNHTGRDFFAFKDIRQNRESSPYKDWYCNVNFWGNNEYNDGFSYENWGGYNLLVKLNQRNPAVRDYICDVIRFWVSEFDIDGIRLDAADVLDFDFMKALRHVANEVKPQFWLMGEVIHGDYTRWVNEGTLHSVTNYHLHKALYSGHNDHNFFEIAHTVKRLYGMGGNRPDGLKLYNFVDNHDVERIYTKLSNKAHFTPVHVLLYTLPGVPSVYYGSEFGIEGKKERHSDASLRPALRYEDYMNAVKDNPCTRLIAALGKIRQQAKALSYGDYKELVLTNRQYAFSRSMGDETVLVAVNNDDNSASLTLPACGCPAYVGALSGVQVTANGGNITVNLPGCSGEIWLPVRDGVMPVADTAPIAVAEQAKPADNVEMSYAKTEENTTAAEAAPDNSAAAKAEATADNHGCSEADAIQPPASESGSAAENSAASRPAPAQSALDEAYEQGRIAGLQEAILAIMSKNGPITDQMRRDVTNNVYHDSLINWIKSFR